MQVVATREGTYGTPPRVRKPGDTFEITDDRHFSKRWMLDTSTPEGKAFLEGLHGDPEAKKNINRRDKLTGERLAAGGISEQLAITLEENRVLKEKIAELNSEIEVLRDRAGPPKPTKDVNPAETPDEDKAESRTPQRVRRRAKK